MFEVIDAGNGRIIKAWSRGVPFEDKAVEQLKNTSKLPFIYKWIAAMPDTHWGMGSTVGTVLPTRGAVVPACVGVDIGCGMIAVNTGRQREEFGDLKAARELIENVIPVGRTNNGGPGDRGAWGTVPENIQKQWDEKFAERYERLLKLHPMAKARNTVAHLGTLGTGNHFIELSEDEIGYVWLVLHSGSRGMGNKIGSYFTGVAQRLCQDWFISLPDRDLAYLPESTLEFLEYMDAVQLAQDFAWENRITMVDNITKAFQSRRVIFRGAMRAHCHHNYISLENHFGENVMVTRKGAVRARLNEIGIIPGSMGAKTYIVRGLGNPDSFCSCSHGAGRAMGRKEAERRFTLAEHQAATAGVECANDASTLDETPGAYKDIDAVMAAQADLVEPVHVLKQFLCVKGGKD